MPKQIVSPSSKWPGLVVLADPLNMPQALAWEKAIRAAQELQAQTQTEFEAALLPGVCACVEKWELQGLENITPDTFPATPRAESAKLIGWLVGEITNVYTGSGEVKDPNA